MKVNFETIANLFDDSWDIGYLTSEQLAQCSQSPLKAKFHIFGKDVTNGLHFQNLNHCLIFAKQGHTWDYSHYQQIKDTLKSANIIGWNPLYTNYKEAAILAGMGVRAKNSLIYSYKFGFDCHFAAVEFTIPIENIPDRSKKVNTNLWKKCEGCNDCAVNCPAGAIHLDKEPYWLDGGACENFIFFGEHDTVPNVRDYWHKNVHPEYSDEVVKSVKSVKDMHLINGMKWDSNGYEYDGNITTRNGDPVYIPHCRECTSQPRCSKWNGKYPYE